MTIVVPIAIVAALFVIYGLVRPRVGCAHDCGECGGPCHASGSNHEHQ